MNILSDRLLDDLSAKAAATPRKRANYNLHQHLDDPVQRLLNAIEPGTYIQPHRHQDPATWEIFFVVRGTSVLLTFDEQGTVRERLVLKPQGPERGVEIGAGMWHTIVSLEPGTVFLEVKKGPYVPPQPENRAAWAPPEGSTAAARFESWFRTAHRGDSPPKTED